MYVLIETSCRRRGCEQRACLVECLFCLVLLSPLLVRFPFYMFVDVSTNLFLLSFHFCVFTKQKMSHKKSMYIYEEGPRCDKYSQMFLLVVKEIGSCGTDIGLRQVP